LANFLTMNTQKTLMLGKAVLFLEFALSMFLTLLFYIR
jgi:hypothetical protein